MTATLAVLLWLGGLAAVGFAYYWQWMQKPLRKQVEDAVKDVTNAAGNVVDQGLRAGVAAGDEKGAAVAAQQDAVLGGAADVLRALGDLTEKLGKVSPPVAALVVATIPWGLATAAVIVDVLE